MLEMTQRTIKNLQNDATPFNQVFMRYMLSIQDEMLEKEVRFLPPDIRQIDVKIDSLSKELIQHGDALTS